MNILGLIGTITGGLGLIIAAGSLWVSCRNTRKIEQYHKEGNRPELSPTLSTKPAYKEDKIYLDSEQVYQHLTITNKGKGNAYKLGSVLIGYEIYNVSGGQLHKTMKNEGFFWSQQSTISIAPGHEAEQKIFRNRSINVENTQIIKGYSIYAPPEPTLGQSMQGKTPLISARYTLTYRGVDENKYTSKYDFNHIQQSWETKEHLKKVKIDLIDLLGA